MQFGVIGTDHRRAAVTVRERLAFDGERLTDALQALAGNAEGTEVAILSTCNRTEVYIASEDFLSAAQFTIRYLATTSGLTVAQVDEAMLIREGMAAISHLFEVASGLQSMVLAESQVLTQVRVAGEIARDSGTGGPLLHAAFRAAIVCGKRVRAETSLGQITSSVPGSVVASIQQEMPNLANRTALLVGAGKMNRLAADKLRDVGIGRLIVASRTRSAAEALAGAFHGQAVDITTIDGLLSEVDIVICATRSPRPVITKHAVAAAMAGRHTPLLIFDMAVPRDVEPEVSTIPGVILHDIDALAVPDSASIGLTQAAEIVAQETANFSTWLRTQQVVPLIAALRVHVDRSKDVELARTLKELAHLSPQDQEAVAEMAHRLVNKMFHHLATRVKRAAADPDLDDYLPVIRYLFTSEEPETSRYHDHAEVASSKLTPRT